MLLCASVVSAAQPNILFVLIDDMGYADLSCFGGERAKTPNIDRLAAEGIRFTKFYVNAPICSPSRVAFTTGQYPNRWRITSYLSHRAEDQKRGMADWLSPDAPTLARFLHDAGYHTAHVGKWHMGGQRDVGDAPPISAYGFDTSLTNFEGLGERLLPTFKFKHEPTLTSAELGGPFRWVERKRVSEEFCNRAIEEIDRATKQNKPFYINLWPDDVHTPCLPDYVSVLNELDRQLGRVFYHIRSDAKLRDNTIILLASDNGHEIGQGSAGKLRGSKGQLYEGGIRSPLIVWSPRFIERPATNDTTVLAGMDLAPSLLTLANERANARFDGLDMSETLIGRSRDKRTAPVMWFRPPDRPGPNHDWPDLAIRDGDWKLLIDQGGSHAELFDVEKDPNETNNVAAQHRDVVNHLNYLLMNWEKSTASTRRDTPASRTSAPRGRS